MRFVDRVQLAVRASGRVIEPAYQTRSPGLNPVTAAPTASTTPTASQAQHLDLAGRRRGAAAHLGVDRVHGDGLDAHEQVARADGGRRQLEILERERLALLGRLWW